MSEKSDILTLARRVQTVMEMIVEDIESAETEDDRFTVLSHIENTQHNLRRLQEHVKTLLPVTA